MNLRLSKYLPDSWTEDTYLDEMIGAPDDDFGRILELCDFKEYLPTSWMERNRLVRSFLNL